MRDEYINKLKDLQEEYSIIINQFNSIKGTDTKDRNIDCLITRMCGIEAIIDSIYIQAKANNITLN